jgi:hypothetical protein
MFNRLLQWLQSLINRDKLQKGKPKHSNSEEGKFIFLGISISYSNPTWRTVLLAIIFLITVIIIIYGLREYIMALKAISLQRSG